MLSRTTSTCSLCQWLVVIGVLVTGILSQETDDKGIYTKLGERVKLPCQLPTIQRPCRWNRGNDQSVDSEHPEDSPGYTIQFGGDKESGDCTMEIESVTASDDGIWKCSKGKESLMVTLNVIVIPGINQLSFKLNNAEHYENLDNDAVKIVSPDDIVQLQCVSENGKPAPSKIEWYEGNVLKLEAVNENLHPEASPEDENLFKVSSTYEYTVPSAVDPNPYYRLDGEKEKKITCAIYHQGFPAKVHKILATFGEQYKTTLVETQDAAGEGKKTGSIVCQANGIPEPTFEIEFRQEDNDVWKKEVTGSTLNTTKFGVYRCVAIYTDPTNHIESRIQSLMEYKLGSITPVENTSNDGSTSTAETGTIVGIVIGALILLALIGGITMFTFKRRKLCFAGVEESRGPRAAENGNPQQPMKKEQAPMVDKKDVPDAVNSTSHH